MSSIKMMLAAALLLVANTSAHMFINSPVPIEGTFPKDPLDPSGSNFPCHGVSLPGTGGEKMAAGSEQMLSFELAGGANTAVHGGGSCQLSLTYETDAAKQKDPANWLVIYSILGGCPADTVGNLASAIACTNSGATDCVNDFPFTIPKGVKNGHAILAWTWFNNVGNREMYMNCVNAEITGGDGSEMDKFPAMFVANLAAIDTCPTTESVGVQFPNPGKYVTTVAAATQYPMAVPTGEGCTPAKDGGSPPVAPSYGGGGAAPTAAPAPSSAPMPAPAPTSAPAPSSYAAPKTLVTSIAPPPAYTPPATPPSAKSGSCAAPKVSCPTDGALICIDNMHFGICDHGCGVPQAVAPGTTCSEGTIKVKRGVTGRKHVHGHAKW